MPLTFPRQHRQVEFGTGSVAFAGQDADKTVVCRISGETLQTSFGASGTTGPELLAAFDRHRDRIEATASRKYDLGELDDVSVSLTPADFAVRP
jgi:hypothetical protein